MDYSILNRKIVSKTTLNDLRFNIMRVFRTDYYLMHILYYTNIKQFYNSLKNKRKIEKLDFMKTVEKIRNNFLYFIDFTVFRFFRALLHVNVTPVLIYDGLLHRYMKQSMFNRLQQERLNDFAKTAMRLEHPSAENSNHYPSLFLDQIVKK